MKMSKKVREYKSGDFIFAKVKGYPAWPARVQRPNGKKYFVYFYGTGETANLPPNMIFDYAENKDKFLTKTVKRRDFNDGVKQIEHDFANNIPLEQVVGSAVEPVEGENNTINESANETADETMGDTTVADETITEENTTQNDTGIEDSDETGALVIDEGKTPVQKGKKSTAKTPAKETPKAKEPKTPRSSRQKKEDEEVKEDDKKEEEIVSRSGRKIRPKRYIDEQTEDNTTLPSPAPKKRRGVSPVIEKEKEKEKEKPEPVKEKTEKNIKHFNAVPQFELEDLKQPFTPEDAEKDNIIITYLPSGQYIGVRLFQSRPSSFKNDNSRLQWDRQAAANALTLKSQLEKGQITPQSVQEQLVMDLNLTEEEKATLDKGRETEEKKSRVQFLKTEMKLIELDTKIKTCLCLEKADTELCLKLLDELTELDLKPLMLLKHPSCVETIKRMRAYVGNTPSWDLSTDDALVFSQRAKQIRDSADKLYQLMKELFTTPEGLSFWEFFSERVSQFKKVTAKLTSDELLELVHEPLEMTVPTSHTMKSSIEASNEDIQEEETVKKKNTPAKSKKTNGTPSKAPVKRQSSRRLQEDKEKELAEENEKEVEEGKEKTPEKENDIDEQDKEVNDDKEKESNDNEAVEEEEKEKTPDKDSEEKELNDSKESIEEKEELNDKEEKSKEKSDSKDKKEVKDKKDSKDKKDKSDSKDKSESKEKKDSKDKNDSKDKKESKDTKGNKDKNDKDKKKEKEEEKEKNEDEPRAKRSRESKKTEPPPRSPTKRKSKVT